MTRIAPARPAPAADLDEPLNPRVRMGDNQPSIPERPVIHDVAKSDFEEAIDQHPNLRKRISDLVDSATRAEATDDETMARCTELLRQITAVEKVVERERETVKVPFREAGQIIDDAARGMLSRLTEHRIRVSNMARAYMLEKQRVADAAAAEEQAKRLAAQAEARVAAGRAPAKAPTPAPAKAKPVQVRSEFGGVATTKALQIATIVDWDLAFNAVRTVPAVKEAIQKAVNALVRVGQANIPGVELDDDVGLAIR